MFTDTHCHLFSEYFEDIYYVISHAKQYHVDRYISASTDLDNAKELIELSKIHKDLFFALGIHPEDLDQDFEEMKKLIEENLDNTKFVAIGEIGLDYYYSKDDKEKQIEMFEKHLALAEKYNLPVVVHSREATLDTIACLKKYKVKGTIHCFSGSLETAKEYIKIGFYIGVGGVMTFKKANIKDVIKELPLDRLLLETDSPYLTPEPYRKFSNEPRYVEVIANFLANLKEVSIDDISKQTEENVDTLFFNRRQD